MNKWLEKHLVCPRDKNSLVLSENKLICPNKHIYLIFNDIPIMLVDDAKATHGYINQTLENVYEKQIEEAETGSSIKNVKKEFEIDDFVQGEIPYTSGNLYWSLQNNLTRYPIPEIRLPKVMAKDF
jgi:uncharacterized protein YbaR (Trm112 family)